MNTAEANGINRNNQVGNKAMNYVILKLWNWHFDDDECWGSKYILLKNDKDLNINAQAAITEYAILHNMDKPKGILSEEIIKDIADFNIEQGNICEYTNRSRLAVFCYDSASRSCNHLEAIAMFTSTYELLGRTTEQE